MIQSADISTDLGTVRCQIAGDGPAVMLFHIARQSSDLMRELMEALASRRRVVAMDYPGHGRSQRAAWQPTMPDYARCAGQVLDRLGADNAMLAGEAAGSAVAACLAANQPGRARGLVMMNAPLFPDAQTAARFVEDFRGASLRSEEEDLVDPAAFVEGAAPFAPLLPDASWLSRLAQARRQCADDCWQPAMALATFDFRGALERVSCPVLMLAGSQSPFRPFLEGRPATSGPAEVSIVPDARFSISWEKAELVAARIVEFEERNEEILQQDACGS